MKLTLLFVNPQSDYYSMFKVNNALNNQQGIDIFLFHGKIRSVKKNSHVSLDSKQDIITIITETRLNPNSIFPM